MAHGEAELFHHYISGCRGAEPLYADDISAVADITMPALRQTASTESRSRIEGGKTESRYSRGCRSYNSQLGMETTRA